MIRLRRRPRLLVAGAVLLCVLTASAYGAHRALERGSHRKYALYQFAQNPPWFKAQLKRVNVSGGTIRMPTGRVAPLQLFDLTPNNPIRLVGQPSTRLSGISIKRSQRIVLSGVRITPAGGPAIADVSASSDITFRDVRFLGTEEDTGVALQLDPDDRDITISRAEFAHCQHGLACILAQGSGLVIDHVRFHDVRDADVIRGAADDVTISDSDLHDALTGAHKDNHNDLIQILGGGPWTIVR
ncbi:MAG TPA: right-handed parallel beta-helix repeat-containing protein, partial [Gaiellales bacterium]|nr:right-handed parallel beta-helix repeat-containing protein [Gaiellales bacterium]